MPKTTIALPQAGEVKILLQDYHALQQSILNNLREQEIEKKAYDTKVEVMYEFFNYLKTSPYVKDIMDGFNKSSDRLTMFVDESKKLRIKINGEKI